jgi:dCMP deaminase
MRLSKSKYYLEIARQVAARSTCLVSSYGCVIVKNDYIVATGYNGSPRGVKNCSDFNICVRDQEGLSRYNSCRAVHSESNAMLHANYDNLIDSTMYIARLIGSKSSVTKVEPCQNCQRLILNAQVAMVVCLQDDDTIIEFEPKKWIGSV